MRINLTLSNGLRQCANSRTSEVSIKTHILTGLTFTHVCYEWYKEIVLKNVENQSSFFLTSWITRNAMGNPVNIIT